MGKLLSTVPKLNPYPSNRQRFNSILHAIRKKHLLWITGSAALVSAPMLAVAFASPAPNAPHVSSASQNTSTGTNSTPPSTPPATTNDSATTQAPGPNPDASGTSANTDNTSVNGSQTTTSVTSTSDSSGTHTSVMINGHPVAVPDTGSVQKTVSNGNSQTSVNISSTNSNSGNSTSDSSSAINLNVSTDNGAGG